MTLKIHQDSLHKAADILWIEPAELLAALKEKIGAISIIVPACISVEHAPDGKPCRLNQLALENGVVPQKCAFEGVAYIIGLSMGDPALVRVQLAKKGGGWLGPMIIHPDYVDLITDPQ